MHLTHLNLTSPKTLPKQSLLLTPLFQYGLNALMHPGLLTSHAKTYRVSLTGRLSP